MSAPRAITASTFPAEARRTASGSSKEPGTFTRVMSFSCTPCRRRASTAPSTRRPVMQPQTGPLDSDDFLRVVRQQPDFPDPKVHEDLGAHPVISQVRLESEALVRLDRAETPGLQPVGQDLVFQAASPP